MAKVRVKVVGKPYRRHAVGDALEMSRRDARYLAALGRVEVVEAAEDVDFTPSEKLEDAVESRREKASLKTPEAPLENVAHVEEDEPEPKKRRRSRKKKGE